MIFHRLFDFLKTENMKLLKAESQKLLSKKIAEEKKFKVLSNEVLEKTEYFTNALVRFIENKSKKVTRKKDKNKTI